MSLKKAVFAPMPNASVSTATGGKPGFFSNWRKANFKSVMVRGQWSVVRGPGSLVGRRPNSQSPYPKRQRKPKLQVPNGAAEAPRWRLTFGAYLGFGFWDLGFSFVSQRHHRIDSRGAPRRPDAGQQAGSEKDQ